MKKILASILTIAMLMTTLSVSVIPASAENAAVATSNVVFEETFEGYGAQDWTSALDANGYVTGVDNMKAQTWTLYGSTNFNVEGAKPAIKVVEFPAGSGNKALEVNTGSMAANEWFRLRRNAADSNDGMKRTDLTGKVLVIKADIWTSQGYATASDTAVFGYDPYKTGSSRYFRGIGRTGGSRSWYLQGIGGANWGSATHGRTSYSFPNNNTDVTTVKFVHNLTGYKEEGHEADTFRAFANNTILTVGLGNESTEANYNKQPYVNSKFPQPAPTFAELVENGGQNYGKVIDGWGGYNAFASSDATSYLDFGDFYGASLSISQRSGYTDQVMHMDNLVAYYIDEFKQVGDITYGTTDANGGWYKDGIEIPFNNAIRTATLTERFSFKGKGQNSSGAYFTDTVTTNYELSDLVDVINVETDEAIEGVTVTTADDGKTLVVTPPKGLDAGVTYKIVASPLFMDAEGQGLNIYSKETELTTFTTGVDPYAHIIYDFDFENNKIDDVNWIESRNNTTDRYVVADGVELGAITINKHSSLPADHGQSIKVVYDPAVETPDENTNKVLALKAGYADGTNVKTGWVTQLRFNANGKTGLSRSTDMGKGKNLVYKAKIFVPDEFAMTESSQLVNTAKETQASANTTSGIGGTMSGNFYAATTGKYGTPMSRHQVGTYHRGKWVEWKHVADVSESLSATHSDTVRAYVDDVLYTSTFAKTNAASETYSFGTNAKYDHNLSIGGTVIDYLTGGEFEFTDSVPYVSLGATWWGSAFNINPQATTTKDDTFYLDDVEAFWIDDLTFNAVNAENFEGGKVKLNFNQRIREEVQYMTGNSSYNMNGLKTLALADLFKIVDLEGNVVENGIAAVALSADGKTVSIAPSGELEKGGDYKLEISPYLVDEYGQGLLNNSLPTYVDLHISETFTPFEMTSISQTAVSGFAQGRDVKVTATFSVAVDDEAITNGIVVKNEAGDVIARNNGWTANFGTDEDGNVDYKTVVFDFGSLPTDNYEVTINEYFTATNGADLSSAFEITINKANDKIVLFEEDFDDYATGNWLETGTEVTDGSLYSGNPNTWTKAYYKSYTVNNRDWDVQQHWTTTAANTAPASLETDDFAGIVEAPAAVAGTNMSGNALKISNTRGTSYNADYVTVRRNFDKGNDIDLLNGEYAGKKLVYEADIYAPVGRSDTPMMAPSLADKYVLSYSDTATWKLTWQTSVMRSSGSWKAAFANYGPIAMYSHATTSDKATTTPVKLKMVVSKGENVDSIAIYSNGKLLQRAEDKQKVLVGHEFNDSARHEFLPIEGGSTASLKAKDTLYGVYFTATAYGKGSSEYYIDNLKAYLVDEFKVESVEGAGDVFNTAKGAVTYTFSKPVNAGVAANTDVVLLDAEGNKVEGGIASVVLSDANYKMTVKLSDTLPGKTQYTIKLNETLTDVDGLALSTEWKYYEYPIDQFYTGADNVYSITDIAGTATLDCTYTPATASEPAYLAFGSHKVAVDTWVRDADAMKMFTNLTTSKATSLFADATTATVAGNTVSTSVVFTNPEVAPMNVWCVVAAFGDYNEMLGCTPVDVTEVEASSSTEEIPVTVVTNGGAVKSVKLFVWNSYEDMKPYQKAEEIMNK